MKTQVWIDKSGWPSGPWDAEPDKAEWVDEATGLTCLVRRNDHMGVLCGYVGVPNTHPLHGKDYNDVDADVHGGLTFAGPCNESDKEHGICHVGPEVLWWFGFDCGHYRDYAPGMWHGDDGFYRDLTYVREQCGDLARQLAQAVPT